MIDNRAAVKAAFKAEGIAVSEWGRARGFDVRLVRAVLYGQCKGVRGESHKIAVALGLKEDPAERRFRIDNAA